MEKEINEVSGIYPDNSVESLHHRVKKFKGGNIGNCLEAWKVVTNDVYILDIIRTGLKLNFASEPPSRGPFEYGRSAKESHTISEEVEKLLKKRVITPSVITSDDYFSNLFTTPKKDGTYRTILNLKYLNTDCETHHFKMDSLHQAIHMIRPGCYLASIDIKDAFYSVPIHFQHKKFLKFMWKGKAYQFEVMPNGYIDAMRIFTKILKPAFSHLREEGHTSIIYVDDSLLGGDTYAECLDNVHATMNLLQQLGFVIHPVKSVLIPSQELVFLGFIINTRHMTITLTVEKKHKIHNMASSILSVPKDIRSIARFLGNITAAMAAVRYGKLYYRHIEYDKIAALKKAAGNFDSVCPISQRARDEITWWLHNIHSSFAYMKNTPYVDVTIHTDASDEGWGASDGTSQDINGRWSDHELALHINVKELMAIKFAIQAYTPLYDTIRHIRIMSDNTTAIAYVNKQGGTQCMILNDIAVEIWEFCKQRNIHLSSAHIPGIHNTLADTASRKFHDSAEWMIPDDIFGLITAQFGKPDIDLFASRLNHKVASYVSWKPDPGATYIDAFSLPWSGKFIYLFPPFSLIWPIMSKMEKDRVGKAIIVMPRWSTQSWFPRLMKKVIAGPIQIPSSKLVLPGTQKSHPMAPKLKLVALLIGHMDR